MLSLLLAMQVMVSIPEEIRRDLDAACTGWRLAPVTPEVEAEIHTRTPSWPANLIPGDFNGDGETDAAALVDCKGGVQLVAFLATSAGFSKQVLEQPQPLDPRQFLHLIRREYEHDAIGVEYDAVGGHAWILRDGRWQSVSR
jgi:hypothetical protein